MKTIPIEPFKLLLASGFILVSGLLSILFSLKMEKILFVGMCRTFIQLLLLGYLLLWVFSLNNPLIIILLLCLMILFAAKTATGRLASKPKGLYLPTLLSILIPGLSITFMVTEVVIDVKPWYEPRYLIPLGGMVIGNSMNGISISLNQLFQDFKSRKDEINGLLALGATSWEASLKSIRSALYTGLIPVINSMNAVGIVFIPGVMTGQILAGADPIQASSYQIVVMLMLSAATTIGSIIAVSLSYRLAFNSKHQFILKT